MTLKQKAEMLRDLIGFINDVGDNHHLYIGDEQPGPDARSVQSRLSDWAAELDELRTSSWRQDFFNTQPTETT
tara:strand:+ start:139 stop:357 length:219 start_codon:yes stop_codon:yes gene_type:complete